MIASPLAPPIELEFPIHRALSLRLPHLEGAPRRGLLRALLAVAGGAVRVEGADRLAAAPTPAVFAMSHHNVWETVLAPSALIAARQGRGIRFLVDWMFVDLPWTGWLVRQVNPIPVYNKRAKLGLRERHRRARLAASTSPVAAAVAALAAGDDVGLYPEGRRSDDAWRLGPARLGIAAIALRSGAPVVPVGVDFTARERLRRQPRAGRFVLRVGEPLAFTAEREAWREARDARERRRLEAALLPRITDRTMADLARLSRKLYFPSPPPARVARRAGPVAPAAAPAPVAVRRVETAADRASASEVLRAVYRDEKGWLAEVDPELRERPDESWFLARSGERPVGVLKVAYDPPLELPEAACVELDPGVDVEQLARSGRFAELGRLAVRPEDRRRPGIVLELMTAAIADVLDRGVTHLLTAVFEDDPHSPLGFHTRVLGFERIGTHLHGELACRSRRILLVLELERAFATARGARARLVRAVEALRRAREPRVA